MQEAAVPGQHGREKQSTEKKAIVSIFTSFSDLFQSSHFWRGEGTVLKLRKRNHYMAVTMSPPCNSTFLVNSLAKK